MVDADHDGEPGGGHIAPTGRETFAFAMDGEFCKIEDQAWGVRYEEDQN